MLLYFVIINFQLNEVNSNLRDKTIKFFTLLIEYEKVVKELNKIKSDFTATLSQKQMFKDSNVRLNSQLKAMVEDSNVSNNINNNNTYSKTNKTGQSPI